MTQRDPNMNTHAAPADAAAVEEVEHYQVEDSGQPLHLLSLRGSAGSQRLVLDDLEFLIEEAVTADELAQGIFVLAGGIIGAEGCKGESAQFLIHYSPAIPGKIGLEHKAPNPGSDECGSPQLTWLDDGVEPRLALRAVEAWK